MNNNHRPRVFICNEPLRRNATTGDMERTISFDSATEYGVLVFLLPPGPLPGSPQAVIATLHAGLADFTQDDFLLPIGDTRAIAWAAAIAADKTGGPLKLLHWQRNQHRYDPVVVDLFPDQETEAAE